VTLPFPRPAGPAARFGLGPGLGLTLLLAALTAVSPLLTDMYLPSLPGMAADFGTGAAEVQLTLSLYIVAYGTCQLIAGPLSDRFGRRPVIIGGLALYGLASLLCTLATTVWALIGFRLIQAIGAAMAPVTARAVVRDLYHGPEAGRMLSTMGALMGLVPAIAPVLGAFLDGYVGWRGNFGFMALTGLSLAAAGALLLNESLEPERRAAIHPLSLVRTARGFFRHGIFVRTFFGANLCYGGFFAFIAGSPFVLQDHFGLSALAFSWCFAATVIGYMAGTIMGGRLSIAIGIDRLFRWGCRFCGAAGLILVALPASGIHQWWGVLGPVILYLAGMGLVLPQGYARGLMPFPHAAGLASSLMGAGQMFTGGLVGWILGRLPQENEWPMVLLVGGAGVLIFLVGGRRD